MTKFGSEGTVQLDDGGTAATLLELSRARARLQGESLAYTFLRDGELDAEELTYAGLDQRARAIAALLQQQSCEGQPVLLLYPPGLEYVAAFLGCIYAGAIAVPAYPPDPARLARTLPRLAAIASDAGAAIALTTSSIRTLAQMFAAPGSPAGAAGAALGALRWLATDAIALELAESWREPALRPESLAFLQYTSGSTGAPRGVMLSHGNLLHNSAAIHACFEHGPASRGVIWLPPYHDMGLIGGVLQPLCGGFPVVLMSPLDFLRKPVRWLRAISRYRATTSGGPNFAYDLCVRRVTEADRDALDLSSWDLAFNGAEPVHPATLARFTEAFARCGFRARSLYPCYGLAEATLIATGGAKAAAPVVRAIERADLERGAARPADAGGDHQLVGCGAPIPGHELRIVAVAAEDPEPAEGTPARAGEVGEIWLRGPSVAQGYWRRPDETQRAFGAALAGAPGARWLRTGDLGFLLDGELFVTGRIKDLIIVRGRNLYPQDLERTAASAHAAARPGCTAAFAVPLEPPALDEGERVVIAQEVDAAAAASASAIAEVAAAIRAAIAAEHDVAVHEVVLLASGALPKTSSGKVQRSACRAALAAGSLEVVARVGGAVAGADAPARPDAAAAGPAGASGDPVQLDRAALLALPAGQRPPILAAYLRDRAAAALEVRADALGEAQPLTAFGLDSIRAAQLAAAVDDELGLTLSAAALLDGGTLAGLARALAVAAETAGAADDPALARPVARPPGRVPPLSFAQERLWFLDQLTPGSSAYTVGAAIRLTGELDVRALERSVAALVARHEALRTAIAPGAAGPEARVLDPGAAAAWRPFTSEGKVTELPWLADAAARAAAASARAAAFCRQPVPLDRAPLLRCELIRSARAEHVLALAIHHAAVDGWALGILVRELGALYRAHAAAGSGEAALPPPPLQYGDFAAWQRHQLAAGAFAPELAYWRDQLAGAPPLLQLPLDRPRPAQQSFAGARHALHLSRELTAALRARAEAEGTTLFAVLLAGVSALLSQRTGRTDLVIGTDLANRDHRATQELVGLCVNQVAMRIDTGGALTARQLVARARAAALGALAHHRLPFDRLVEALRPARDPAYNPLFQVMVVLESAPMPRVELPGLALELVELDDGGSPFDLSVLLTEAGGAVSGALRYSTALFDAATIAALAADLTTALEVIADQPEATLPALAATLAERARTRRRAGAESLDASRAARLGRLQPRSAAGAGSRAAAASSPASWIQFEPLLASGALPCLARPARPGIDLAGWISDHRDQVQSRIHQHGAVLFRGFGVTTAADFDRAIAAVSEAALPYTERSSPRSSVAGNIYTSTDHPADQHIFLHNEQSYNLVFPLRIFFCCVTAAQSGGETPLADSRRVFQRIAPAVRERFLAQGYQYVRSFHPHFGLSWQDAFQTTDPAVVDAYCRAHEIEVEWRSGSRLRTRQRRRAAGIHPVTGEATWFNHATFFHVSTLPPAVSAMLLAQLGEDELPNQTYYGDGTPIEPEVIEALRDAYRAETVMFPWQAGDVLAVDNMLVAHGRTPFTGPRRVLAGMAQPVPWAAIAPARTATE